VPAVSYHFVPGVNLKDFTLADKNKAELISKDAKSPSILKTGQCNPCFICYQVLHMFPWSPH